MDTADALAITQDAIQKVLGTKIQVKCAVVGNKAGSSAGALDVEADGIVSTAMNLGGKLVHRE